MTKRSAVVLGLLAVLVLVGGGYNNGGGPTFLLSIAVAVGASSTEAPPRSKNRKFFGTTSANAGERAAFGVVDDEGRLPKASGLEKYNVQDESGGGGGSGDSWSSGYKPKDESRDEGSHDEEEERQSESSHPLLQLPCRLTLPPCSSSGSGGGGASSRTTIRAYCDTGAQRTVMSWGAARSCGLLPHLDRRYANGARASGVGSCRVMGRLPAGMVSLRLLVVSERGGGDKPTTVSVPSPAITVLEETAGYDDDVGDMELLLGLDFLREHRAVLDLRHDEMQLTAGGREVTVAFTRPKGSPRSTVSTRRNSPHTAAENDEDDDDEEDGEYEEHGEKVDMSGI